MLTYKKKIYIDRTFGGIAIFLMKYLARVINFFARKKYIISENPKVIVVSKMVGLGSIVYTGILCRALKEKFPKSKLIYLTSYGSRDLVEKMGYIDNVFIIDDRRFDSMFISTLLAVFRLWRLRPALYFDMEVYSNWSTIIATLSMARNRYGFYRKNAESKKGLHTKTVFFNTRRHISEIYGQLALCVGAKPKYDLSGILKISDINRIYCSDFLKKYGISSSSIVLVNVNASELLLERRWPAERWIEYFEAITTISHEVQFLLIGSAEDKQYVADIYHKLSESAKNAVKDISGKLKIGELLALIERCLLLVTNDSGPLHFAAALGKPTISIWGPSDPGHYEPLQGRNIIIYKAVYCSPCLYHTEFPPCEGNNICMKGIKAESAIEATKDFLAYFK